MNVEIKTLENEEQAKNTSSLKIHAYILFIYFKNNKE